MKTQEGTARVVAVGRVTATATEPMYSTRFGEQSAETIVSVLVLPVMALPETPGSCQDGGVATPEEGVDVKISGTLFGVVGPASRATAGVAFSYMTSPRVVIGLTNPPLPDAFRVSGDERLVVTS